MAHPGGRPTKYKPEYAEQAYKYCLLGAKDEDLARLYDVDITTIDNWKHAHPEFFGAIKEGREEADANVAKSLYHRATGYDVKAEKAYQYRGQVVKAEVIEHVPADTAAAFIWLKNRRPKDWRDKQEIDLSIAPVTIVNDLDG